MTKIVFCFAGTEADGKDYAAGLENSKVFDDDVIRVYLAGCYHAKVGGGTVFPDLDIVATKIRKAFSKDENGLVSVNLKTLTNKLGTGLCRIEGQLDVNNPTIESIGLQGFSRGAVTTLAVAKKLNNLLDNTTVKMDLILNQPVPGPGSIYRKYNNVTKCTNIRSATTLLGSYNLENGIKENLFYQQMVAKFPSAKTTEVNTWLMPHQAHEDWFKPEYKLIPRHISKLFVNAGYAKNKSQGDGLIISEYKDRAWNLYFTPKEFSQKILGARHANITKDPVYLKMIQNDAKNLCEQEDITDEQASAIVAISKVKLSSFDHDKKKELYKFILEDNDQAKKFVQIVNKVHEVTEYLVNVTDVTSEKSKLIKEHSHQYKKEVFEIIQSYLSNNKADDKQFIKSFQEADKQFESNALDIDRGIMRKALQIITNSILHATGLFLIANTLNLAITGQYLFWNKTRSTQVMRNASSEIKEIVTSKNNIDVLHRMKEDVHDLKRKTVKNVDVVQDESESQNTL